ncbi:MAG: hypothetical protein JNK48_12670 [Bryobacterales bacterium]|nr:hypothetical protein [Bryobacterales bacterium]
MDPGTLELQIFLSLIVVLATAFVALVCDYLKGSNESLRERNIELKVRQQERDLQRLQEEWNNASHKWPVRTPVIRTPIKPVVADALPGWPAASPAPPPAEALPELPAISGPAPLPESPQPQSQPSPQPSPQPAPVAMVLPPGMHPHSVLARHMSSVTAFSGVVVSIGINEYAAQLEKSGPDAMAELMISVESMISGLLRAGLDFGCRSADDEFLLVFPNEQGADAQRRLASISERLWNFQLRSIGSAAVLFCWGAVEVQGETLADSVASASERMHQTKRNRKAIAMQSKPRKLAV